MNTSDVRVIFMGSPAFAVPSLQALAGAGYPIVGVVTQPDKPAGRGSHLQPPAVKVAAEQLGLHILQPKGLRRPEIQELLRMLQPDVIVVAAYGKILPEEVLEIPRRGCLNVHASLLPRWRGASPVNAAILGGDDETGVSIMEMVMELDAGPVISQRVTPIAPNETTGSLEPRLAELGARELVESLPPWYAGRLHARPQDEREATHCRLISKIDGHVKASMTASQAERAVRAYDPWPGAYILYRGERLGIWESRVVDLSGPLPTGSLIIEGRIPVLVLAHDRDGRPTGLALELLQRPGGRRLTGSEFLNGERGQLAPEAGLA
jgi:methionyl-tRNA formyltransferase